MRRTAERVMWLNFTDDECAVMDRLKASEQAPSYMALIRVALASLADEVGIDIPNGAFERTGRVGRSPTWTRDKIAVLLEQLPHDFDSAQFRRMVTSNYAHELLGRAVSMGLLSLTKRGGGHGQRSHYRRVVVGSQVFA